MAKGIVKYRTGEDLEPIAQAITSMGQVASKEDKTIGLAEKVKKISTDATATPPMVFSGASFYSGGSKQIGTMPNRGANNIVLPVNGTATIPEGYHNGQGRVTQNLPVKGEQNFLPGTTNQTIWGGQYLSGNQTILGDPNLISNNIVKGKTIFGVTGNFIQPEPTVYYIQNGLAVPSLGSYRQISNIHYIEPVYKTDGTGTGGLYLNAGSGQYYMCVAFSNPIDLTLHRSLNIENGTNGHRSVGLKFGLISHQSLMRASLGYMKDGVVNYEYGWTAVTHHSTGQFVKSVLNIEQLSGYYYVALCLNGYPFSNSYAFVRNIYLSY